MTLPTVVSMAHELLARSVGAGDLAVDATVGRGRDTLFLARRAGPLGRVIGFDAHAGAIAQASRFLAAEGASEQVTLVHQGHEHMASWFEANARNERPRAFVFNLGYLPGAEDFFATAATTTLAALRASLRLVAPGGLITIGLYPGHEGGQEEADAVLAWTRALPTAQAAVAWYRWWNVSQDAPSLLAIEVKRS